MSRRHILLISLLGLVQGMGIAVPAGADNPGVVPAWVLDRAAPGENLPAVGRSLFDQVFAVSRGGQTTVVPPFPFEALLANLDAQLERQAGNPLPPAKRVLIPLGRSLQRTAAAPDYFAFPRVVVAVDMPAASPAAPFLKDRLYLGYQEKSAVLEVISYNEAAGRFEFQLVKDYRAGGQPRVVYANRSLCFACHQNGAPIFSRALWDETNANPRIAVGLGSIRRSFYGIPVDRGVDIPYAIDKAVDRANGFALTQRLWREGCGETEPAARQCRAGLVSGALRQALSGGQAATTNTPLRQATLRRLQPEILRRWPGGLAIGNPGLPNRNPLEGLSTWPADHAARMTRSHVAAGFEPLAPRPPLAIWRADSPDALAQLESGLAEFVAAPDRQRLEAALARQSGIATTRMTVPCRITGKTQASRWSVQCDPAPGQSGPKLVGTLSVTAGRPTAGQLGRLTLPGGTALSNLELKATSGNAFNARLDGRIPRTAGGDALTRLELRRDGRNPGMAEITLEIRQEFAVLEGLLTALADGTDGVSLFGPGAFPRQALMTAILTRLGNPLSVPCCAAPAQLPAPRLEVPAVAPGSPAGTPMGESLKGFYPYCATCHQSAETFPPNFLTGDGPEVAARLRQCAPRLYVRLAMADLAPERRDKTPMPPETLLPAFGTDAAGWRASPARAALLAQVTDWLQAESGTPPSLTQLLASGYEALRPCLPAP